MPCFTRIRRGQTETQRLAEIQKSIARLALALEDGSTQVAIGTQGAIAFVDWSNRQDVSDVCAFRQLKAEGCFALTLAIQRAETLAGRTLDAQAVASGVHSHDGGATWSPGH